jgi:hypothetical protein
LRYQKIVGAENKVANAVPFGRRLRRFLREAEQQQLASGRCWRAVGSWMLADALHHWSRGELRLVALVRADQSIAHVVAEAPFDGTYVDADGVAGKLELMAKMALLMGEPQVGVGGFSPLAARQAGLEYDQDVAIELALRLLRRFNVFRPSLLALPDPTHQAD